MLAPLTHLVAEEIQSIQLGALVRIKMSAMPDSPHPLQNRRIRIVGSLVSLDADSLVLKKQSEASPLTIPRASIEKLQVSRGITDTRGDAAIRSFSG